MSRSNDALDATSHASEPKPIDASIPLECGGDPACWAHLVCEECGSVLDGSVHRETCSARSE